jgi:integrase
MVPTARSDPLQVNPFGQREYAKFIAAADSRPIKFHGLRHIWATLLLAAAVPLEITFDPVRVVR